MYKLINLEEKEYDKFVKNNNVKSHFLQSYAWGQFAKKKKGMTPHYLGLVDEHNKIIASALLLQRKFPLGYSYFYSPRGFVIDYQNKELFHEMTKNIIKYVKKYKPIFVKIDPDIIINDYNYLDEKQELSYNPDEIFNIIKSAGFKHLKFTKNFETNQPRYTFRLDLNQSLEDIENHFSKTTKQRIAKSTKLETIVEIGTENDIKEFYHLMRITENRKNFSSYDEDYYKYLYEILNNNQNTKAILFLGKIDLNITIKTIEERLKSINNQLSELPQENLSKSARSKTEELTRQKDNCIKEIEQFQNYQKEYGNNLTLSAHMIIEYGNKAWVLYAGNHNILTETYVNYHTYYEHIKYCKNEKLDIYDQFGTIGDLSKDNPKYGLHEFKKKFGGDYVEFIGEFDYITNKPIYYIFKLAVPIYRKMLKIVRIIRKR